MVTQKKVRFQSHNRNTDLVGLSKDIKPIEDIENGDSFLEIDTGKNFIFNKDTKVWVEQPQNGGGGSEAGGDFKADGSVSMTADINLGNHKAVSMQTPTETTDGATKGYVDDSIAAIPTPTPPDLTPYMKKDGSTSLTGSLQMDNHPITGASSISGPADTGIAIESNLDMNNHKISGLIAPTADADASNKKYVDDSIANFSPTVDYFTATILPSYWNAGSKQTVLDSSIIAKMSLIKDETSQLVIVAPLSDSYTVWKESKIMCINQMAGSLIFECDTVPTVNVTFYVAMSPLKAV